MMGLYRKIKLNFFLFTRSPKFNLDIIKVTQKRIHNNDKVIGWYRGHPTFCLLAPPLFSKAQTNYVATKLLGVYQGRSLPEIMDIAITDKCNCSCEHCSFVSMKKRDSSLSYEKLIKVITEAQKMGVSTINFVGGEPLLHPEILSLIKGVDKDLSQAILFTNGYLLSQKASDLKKSGLTSVIVSIDSHKQKEHDRIRGLPGLFEKAIGGIKEAKKEGLLVGISTVATKEATEKGDLEKLIELGKDLGVNQIIIFDAVPVGNYSCKQHLMGVQPYLEDIIAISNKYNKRNDYPGIFAYPYVKSHYSLGCGGGVYYFYVSPYGEVCPCDFNSMSVGNVNSTPLHLLWDKFSENSDFCKSGWTGCKMQDSRFRNKFDKKC